MAEMMRFSSTSSFKIIHFVMKPERGGSPARERSTNGSIAARRGFLVQEVARLFRVVALLGISDKKVVIVRVI